MTIDDGRAEKRYAILRRIEGTLGKVDVALADIGDHGLHLRHQAPIRLGTEAPMAFRVSDLDLDVRLPGFVVWSRFGSPGDARPYHTGARVDDPGGALKDAIARLLQAHALRADEDSLERKRQLAEERARARQTRMKVMNHATKIPDDVILLVRQARLRLQANPAEIVRWFNRAKYSLNEAGEQIHQRDDVLAVWEYLERSVELAIIARVLDERG